MCVFVCCLSGVHDHVSHSSTVRKIQMDSSCFINVLNKRIYVRKKQKTIIIIVILEIMIIHVTCN